MADTIKGTKNDDNLTVADDNIVVDAGAGNDVVNFKGNKSSISGGNGNDWIEIYGDRNSITGDAGNDTIWSEGKNNTIIGSAGNDSIWGGWGAKSPGLVYVYGGGNDTISPFFDDYQFIVIENYTWTTQLTQNDNGEDRLVIITVLNGSETVGTITIDNFGNGDYENFGKYILPSKDALAEFNFIYNDEDGKNITGTGGNDRIFNNGSNLTITGGAGNDTILNNDGKKVSIDAGKGDNYITTGYNVTVTAGAGNDSVNLGGISAVYVYGGGNDTITGFGGIYNSIVLGDVKVRANIQTDDVNILLRLNNGNTLTLLNVDYNYFMEGHIYSSLSEVPKVNVIDNYEENKVINIDGEKDAINYVGNGAENVTINGSKFNDYVSNGGNGVNATALIDLGAGNDTIYNFPDNSTLIGGDGDDSILNNNWFGTDNNVLIDCGAGNDVVDNSGNHSTISGGSGNDTIWNGGSNVTIEGGKGDDNLASGGDNVLFKYANGDGNDIVYGFNATDTLEISGAKYSTAKSGEDVIVTVGKGNITLSGAASLSAVNIRGTVGGGNDTSSGGGNDTTPAEDSTLLVVTDKTKSPVTVKSAIKTIDATARTKTIKITGNTKANSIVGGSNNDSIYGGKGNDTIRGNKGNDKIFGENGDDILYGGVGKDTLSGGADNDKIFGEDGNDSLSGGDGDDILSGGDDNDKLLGGNGDDSIVGGDGKDTLNGGKGNDTLTGGKGADIFVYKSGDGDDIITDYAKEDKISITSGKASVTTRGNDVIFTVGSGKITLTGGKDKKITYIDDKGEHSYNSTVEPYIISSDGTEIALTKKFVKENFNVKSYGDEIQIIDASGVQHDINITGNNLPNKIIGTSQDDIIDGGGSADTIDGGKGNDSIFGGKGNDSLNGNKADDTLIGGAGSDTLTGGSGADVFVYKKGDGNDIITDYAEEDVISIQSGKATVSTKKNDVIFTVGSNKITVVGAKDKVITYVDSGGEHVYPKIFTVKGATITLTEKYMKNSFNVADYGDYDTINASEVQHGLNIVGNDSANSITGTTDEDYINGGAGNDTIRGGDGNDSIIGGKGKDYLYGGEGNDTLWGGAGNDYLYGGEGADIFIFDKSDGIDKIFGYEQGVDKIMILSNQKPVLVGTPSSNDVTFKVGSSKIVVDNAANTTIEFVKSNGKHLDSYTPSK